MPFQFLVIKLVIKFTLGQLKKIYKRLVLGRPHRGGCAPFKLDELVQNMILNWCMKSKWAFENLCRSPVLDLERCWLSGLTLWTVLRCETSGPLGRWSKWTPPRMASLSACLLRSCSCLLARHGGGSNVGMPRPVRTRDDRRLCRTTLNLRYFQKLRPHPSVRAHHGWMASRSRGSRMWGC